MHFNLSLTFIVGHLPCPLLNAFFADSSASIAESESMSGIEPKRVGEYSPSSLILIVENTSEVSPSHFFNSPSTRYSLQWISSILYFSMDIDFYINRRSVSGFSFKYSPKKPFSFIFFIKTDKSLENFNSIPTIAVVYSLLFFFTYSKKVISSF